jgi:signal transduction histidine kinase
MLGSLRFRLPALFLLGCVLSGLIATLIAIRFFQDYTRTRSIAELRSESVGIVQLYASQAGAREVPVNKLEAAIGGDRIFYVPIAPGVQLFTGRLPNLPASSIPAANLRGGRSATVNLTVNGKKYLAVAQPLKIIDQLFGAMVVAKPVSQLRSRWITLVERLTLALGGGVIVAGLLGVYLSRRITDPLLRLSTAADEVAAGNYDVELPEPHGGDEIAHLTSRFRDMASRLAESEQLSRNFLMSVSHELRTPLTAIRGHVAALREGVFEDESAREASLGVIGEEALRLERLVGDVLDLAKLDAHRFTVLHEEVDMEQLCERVFNAFGEEARRRSIQYRRDFHASPVIMTDGDRVLQIISNLLSNAFRWTPEGGSVELELSASNGSVSVAVADTGPGITDAERDRIFRPFWSRDGGGTGLGLAIANELALALGGRIELRTEPGRGSRFELLLPGPGN